MFRLLSEEEAGDWDYDRKAGTFMVSPKKLRAKFGQGMVHPGEPIKISCQYIFQSNQGALFSLHEYRLVENTDPGIYFWDLEEPEEFSIGCTKGQEQEAEKFKDWLSDQFS